MVIKSSLESNRASNALAPRGPSEGLPGNRPREPAPPAIPRRPPSPQHHLAGRLRCLAGGRPPGRAWPRSSRRALGMGPGWVRDAWGAITVRPGRVTVGRRRRAAAGGDRSAPARGPHRPRPQPAPRESAAGQLPEDSAVTRGQRAAARRGAGRQACGPECAQASE